MYFELPKGGVGGYLCSSECIDLTSSLLHVTVSTSYEYPSITVLVNVIYLLDVIKIIKH